MLVFIDEAGDTGRKIKQGSSEYFVVAMVLFQDHEEANACDQRINLLKRELKLSSDYEFYFSNNSNKIKLEFLKAVQPYQFVYFAIAINKNPKKLWGPGFTTKESFYKYACQMIFTNASPYLIQAIVILDKLGSPDFRNKLAKYLREKINKNGERKIKKIKQQKSSSNNLIQLADYICGIVNRKISKRKDWKDYYKFINSKEILLQIWPK